ncbi:sigma 54-interacting transcriptional regulator [Chitinispirillales bacterium ANBcel5]|uniref:sigma 54-interacting transcriptional regulator n=1 Tax=Cellulosispirillum alkaliphilum TaxID=3039283 RepID=UPI002A4E38A7|nr:sigma 54-interacting transcriptional regulator [Chitinispirillales bacterium ANBcel5]
MEPTHILIIDSDNVFKGKVIESVINNSSPENIRAISIGLEAPPTPPWISDLLESHGIKTTENTSISIDSINDLPVDLVITLGVDVKKRCPVFTGVPPIINWDIKDPVENIGDSSWQSFDFKSYITYIENKVDNFFKDGYCSTLLSQRIYLKNIIDSLQEGIIAHDLDRRIFFFNKSAETITGIPQNQVLGKDCHDLFTPNFCGEYCSFCEEGTFDKLPKAAYSTVFFNHESRRMELKVTRTPLLDDDGNVTGAIATFSDETRVKELEMKLGESEKFSGIIGQDYKMVAIYELIKDLAHSDFSVIISGESGTGKELVAKAIHNESSRRDHPFIALNCGAIPEGTLESELFGHVKGAFTGAIRDKKGRFELADGGTLFLDEVAELPKQMQVKLLRVIQEGTFEPVGSESPKKVNVRIVSASNKDLMELVGLDQFREDLYYRLAVIPVQMPPLRERRNDIPLLANHFLKDIGKKLSRDSVSFSKEAISVMMDYNWPGNVRQLQNAIQFCLIKCHDSVILPNHLPPELISAPKNETISSSTPLKVGRKPKLSNDTVKDALIKSGGNKAKAARMLGVGRATLYNYLNQSKNTFSEAS